MAKTKADEQEQKENPGVENTELAAEQAKTKALTGRISELDKKVSELEADKTQLVAQNDSLKKSNELLATEKSDLTKKLATAEQSKDHFEKLNAGYAAGCESLIALATNNGLKLIEKEGGGLNTDKQAPEVSELETKAPVVQMPAGEQTLHEQRLQKHGHGYVVAKKGNLETVFSANAWHNLGGDKAGWKQVINTPPEVAALADKNKGGANE